MSDGILLGPPDYRRTLPPHTADTFDLKHLAANAERKHRHRIQHPLSKINQLLEKNGPRMEVGGKKPNTSAWGQFRAQFLNSETLSTSLSLSFLVCKVGVIIAPNQQSFMPARVKLLINQTKTKEFASHVGAHICNPSDGEVKAKESWHDKARTRLA